jgi:hypothetical protein
MIQIVKMNKMGDLPVKTDNHFDDHGITGNNVTHTINLGTEEK